SPQSVAVDSSGNLYIADTETSFVREVLANGTILTAAGGATPVLTGSGGTSSIAGISLPMSVAVSANGVYVADTHNDRVLLLSTQASTGSPSIGTGGIVSASGFGDFSAAAPGSFIEIYGSNLAKDTRQWASSDFNGVNAPTSLDGTSVTIGGQAAFVAYISPDQVNAQVPSGVGTGPQPVIVTTASGSTAPSNITINQTEPGLLAPSTFNVGGKQYVVALFGDGLTYVLPPGAIPSLTSREAVPGDEIVLYGVGFGPVTPNIPAGQMEEASNSLAASFQISIGNVPATVKYAGLAPSYVGLYQFNIVVPNVAANDAAALTFSLGGQPGNQTLYIAVGN
ncbi:MAG: IPT/TIG domain-containing protein, partial [Bryobacterales bacterium]|nr:IPT/TIG domain-containing protein [Bryobacterales bacterium]